MKELNEVFVSLQAFSESQREEIIVRLAMRWGRKSTFLSYSDFICFRYNDSIFFSLLCVLLWWVFILSCPFPLDNAITFFTYFCVFSTRFWLTKLTPFCRLKKKSPAALLPLAYFPAPRALSRPVKVTRFLFDFWSLKSFYWLMCVLWSLQDPSPAVLLAKGRLNQMKATIVLIYYYYYYYITSNSPTECRQCAPFL